MDTDFRLAGVRGAAPSRASPGTSLALAVRLELGYRWFDSNRQLPGFCRRAGVA